MAITYVGGQSGASAGDASAALSVTFALAGGSDSVPGAEDVVVVGVAVGSIGANPALAVTSPAGYTALGQLNQSATTSDISLNVSYKRMGAVADPAVTIPSALTSVVGRAYTIQVFRGVSPTTPLDVAAVSAGNTGTGRPDPGAITPVTTGAWVVICAGGATTSAIIYTAPAGYPTNFETQAALDTTGVIIGSGYRTWTGGPEDPATYTGGSTGASDSWAAYTLALRPAGEPIRGAFVAGETTTVKASRAAAFGLDGAVNEHAEEGKLKVFGTFEATETVQVGDVSGTTATVLIGHGATAALEAVTVGDGLALSGNVLAVTTPAVYDAPLSDGDVVAADLIYADGACVIVQVPV